MADFRNANQVDLTPKAQAIMQLMQSGMMPFAQAEPRVKFGPGQPILPTETETEPRIYQYTPGVNLTMIPRAGYGVLPFQTLRAISMACKEVRLNIEHIKRQMRGIEWEVAPVKTDPVIVGGAKWVATPDTGPVDQFMKKPDGVNPFDAWLNMMVEEILVTDALTLYPRLESRDLAGMDIIDGSTIRPLLNVRGAIPTPPSPGYLQVIHGMSMSAWPANVLLYRPLNTKVNSPYGEVGVEWILTTINTAIRYDLSRMGYFTEGNIPGAFYSVPESWTPDQIQVFNDYIDAVFSGDVARAYKLLAVPGGTGSHVTPFQQNDYDKTELNSYLMQVACWAYGNNPAEFGLTPGSGLGGAGFMEGAKQIQYRSLIGPLTKFIGAVLTEIVQDWLRRPDLKMQPKNYKSMEEQTAQSGVDTANINAGVYTVAYVQDRDGIPPEYRPAAQGAGQQTTVPVPVPEQYAAYMKRAIAADLDLWQAKAQRALKKGWDAPVLFKSDVLPPATIAALGAAVRAARSETDLRTAFAGQADLIVGRLVKGDFDGHPFRGNQWTDGEFVEWKGEKMKVIGRNKFDGLVTLEDDQGGTTTVEEDEVDPWDDRPLTPIERTTVGTALQKPSWVREAEAKAAAKAAAKYTQGDYNSLVSEKRHGDLLGSVTAKVYRTGALEGQNGRGIFFAFEKDNAEQYVSLHGDQPVREYSVKTKNTMFAKSQYQLYQDLFGKPLNVNDIDISHKFNSTPRALQWAEARIARKLQAQKIDSVIYESAFGQKELWVLPKNASSMDVVKITPIGDLFKAADPLRAGAETEMIKELESYFAGLQLRIEAEASRLREE